MSGIADGQWVEVGAFENAPGGIRPPEFLSGWLHKRGIDWMPFTGTEIRIDLSCSTTSEGRWRGWYSIKVSATALRRLGLHPDQATQA